MRLVNVAEYESRARDMAKGSTLDYYDGGSNDEITLRENVTAFSRITLYPRVFRGVGQRDTHTTILGLPAATPVIVAPVALIGMLHPEGEEPVVRAASTTGSIVTLSTFSVTPVEDVVAASAGPVWFQLYVYKDRAASEALVRRVEAAGCAALELTADAPILGRRERDVRNNFSLPEDLWAPNLTADRTLPEASSSSGSPFADAFDALVDPNLTWDDVAWLTLGKQSARAGQGHRPRRRRQTCTRRRRGRGDRLEPRRPPVRHVARGDRRTRPDRRSRSRQGRGDCRWRHPARIGRRQSNRDGCTRRSDRSADHVGARRRRRRRCPRRPQPAPRRT